MFLLWTRLEAAAQTNFLTILTNGPVSNRLNVVFLSEGYTTNEYSTFLADTTNALNALLARPPYAEYRSYFNAFAISVPSQQSGSDHPVIPTHADTYFNSSYDSVNDVLITIPPNNFDADYSHGQGKVDTLLQTFMPLCHLPVLLVNDFVTGGSDGFDQTAICSTAPASSSLLAHETGHLLANLGDEYTNANPGFADTEEPNTTQQTNRALIKWNAWISDTTPIPTPNTAGNGVVGLFQGAHYHPTNWYRPQLNCMMRSSDTAFCRVCSEALVLAIYQRVRPVDSLSPAVTNLSVSSTQALAFGLTLLQPATHALSVQWFTNGAPVADATNTAFALAPLSLGNGTTNSVSARVTDNTALVRTDPTNLLSQTVAWTVSVNLPRLELDAPAWLPDGQFTFRLTGTAPQGFVIQTTTNLLDWVSLITNSLVSGEFRYTNSGAALFSDKYFRAKTPP